MYKADHVNGLDETTGSEVPLFHPRRDRWESHFEVDAETGSINGKTPAGRATVNRLQMNSPLPLEARKQWMRSGCFLDRQPSKSGNLPLTNRGPILV